MAEVQATLGNGKNKLEQVRQNGNCNVNSR